MGGGGGDEGGKRPAAREQAPPWRAVIAMAECVARKARCLHERCDGSSAWLARGVALTICPT